ncbi:hypothetical protein D3C81_1262690 [compost metagenome]
MPEFTPGWLTRKAGKPLTNGLIRRSRRRSAIAPISATAMASKSAAMATDWPCGFAWETTRYDSGVPSSIGLSVVELSSVSICRAACSS